VQSARQKKMANLQHEETTMSYKFITASGGFQQITSLSTVKTLTIPAWALGALIQPDTQNVRFRCDGTAPTSTVGMLLVAGQTYYFDVSGADAQGLAALQFIEATASATLNVQYTY
jgi:hypothetical protein